MGERMDWDRSRQGAWRPLLGMVVALATVSAGARTGEASGDPLAKPPGMSFADTAALARADRRMDEWGGDRSQLEAARVEIERVLATNPGSAEAHVRHARYLLNSAMNTGSDYDADGLAASERALDRALGIEPDSVAAHLLLASVYRLQGRQDDARAALTRIEALGPEFVDLHRRWAELLLAEDKPEDALARCERIRASGPQFEDDADRCATGPLWRLGRFEEVEQRYRAIAVRAPGSAWTQGNLAHALLCARNKAGDAAVAATRALELMDYPQARLTLAAALYYQWAELVNAGRQQEAEPLWVRAGEAMDGPPAHLLATACHAGFARPLLKASRDMRRGPLYSPMETVMLAAEAAPDWLPGVFGLEVKGTGRGRGGETGRVFLNSEADYRDPRSITVRFTPEAAAGYEKRHGVAPDLALAGKTVLVYGYARRVRIDFLTGGMPTGKYYYQTHVVVEDPEQVEIHDPDAPASAPLLDGPMIRT
jgi:hypothetical protein